MLLRTRGAATLADVPATLRDRASRREYDAIVVGAGPNGLAAALTLARAGLSVLVLEAAPEAGGGLRSAELTLPGFLHDVCSTIHPTALLSPFFASLGLDVRWLEPPIAVAHPLPEGGAALLSRSLDDTARGLGADGPAWRALFAPLVERAAALMPALFAPPTPFTSSPLAMARFGLTALRGARPVWRGRFGGEAARALFAGCAAHGVLPLDAPGSAAFGLVLALGAHLVGWPLAGGGSRRIAEALVAKLGALGGELVVDAPVTSLADLPPARAILLDVSPGALARLGAGELPRGYLDRLRAFRHGPGVFKLDWALDAPIPWREARVGQAGTVHLGGAADELVLSERDAWNGRVSERPFVILAQTSLFDPSRAPPGKHTAWAYCHVPPRWEGDATAAIEAQVERYAPGFQDRILARASRGPATLERYDANLVGGDIAGGANTLGQVFARPRLFSPYATPSPRLYLCSASTPPGGGVHGMCGHHAARAALRRTFGRNVAPLPAMG